MKMQIEVSNCGGLEHLSWEQQRRIQTCVTRASQVFTLFDKEGFWGWLLHHSNGGIIRMICRFWWWHWLEIPLLLMWVKSCCLGLLFPARKVSPVFSFRFQPSALNWHNVKGERGAEEFSVGVTSG